MKAFYIDYKVWKGEKASAEEKTLRRNLQRNLSAREILEELDLQGGLYGVTNKKKEVQTA